MIVYICGPITGLPNGNIEAFNFAQEQLLATGHHPINPHLLCRDIVAMHEGTPEELWSKCMKRDIAELLKADAVLLLDGWQNSNGAKIERALAIDLGIQVIPSTYMAERLCERPKPNSEPSPKTPDSVL